MRAKGSFTRFTFGIGFVQSRSSHASSDDEHELQDEELNTERIAVERHRAPATCWASIIDFSVVASPQQQTQMMVYARHPRFLNGKSDVAAIMKRWQVQCLLLVELYLRHFIMATHPDEDYEIADDVVSASTPSYVLESKIGDCRRAAAIRREAVQMLTGKSLDALLKYGDEHFHQLTV